MLYALADPGSFAVLLLSTLVALTLHGWLTAVLVDRAGDRGVRAAGRLRPDPRRQIDPFGAVAALVGGAGWSAGVDGPGRRSRGALLSTSLVPAAVVLAVGVGLLVAFGTVAGPVGGVTSGALRAGAGGLGIAEKALLLAGLVHVYTALLSLVPLPPLAGGRLLFGLGPRSAGWQKAEYQLGERNIGVAILVGVSLLVPALLYAVLDAFASPLVRLVTGG